MGTPVMPADRAGLPLAAARMQENRAFQELRLYQFVPCKRARRGGKKGGSGNLTRWGCELLGCVRGDALQLASRVGGDAVKRRTLLGLVGALFLALRGRPVLARSGGGGSKGGGSKSTGGTGTGSNSSSHGVKGYTKKDGTYVAPHRQTSPNSTTRDNYGTRGNYNPYTGKTGTRSPTD